MSTIKIPRIHHVDFMQSTSAAPSDAKRKKKKLAAKKPAKKGIDLDALTKPLSSAVFDKLDEDGRDNLYVDLDAKVDEVREDLAQRDRAKDNGTETKRLRKLLEHLKESQNNLDDYHEDLEEDED